MYTKIQSGPDGKAETAAKAEEAAQIVCECQCKGEEPQAKDGIVAADANVVRLGVDYDLNG